MEGVEKSVKNQSLQDRIITKYHRMPAQQSFIDEDKNSFNCTITNYMCSIIQNTPIIRYKVVGFINKHSCTGLAII